MDNYTTMTETFSSADNKQDLQTENLNLLDRCNRQRDLINEIRSICILIRHACSNPEFTADSSIHIENCMSILQAAIDNSLTADEYQYNQ